MSARRGSLLAALGLAALLPAIAARAANPDALWQIVHGQCAPNMAARHTPTPCDSVDLTGGFAVLKDIHGATQLLLIPTDRMGGIEAPQLLAPGARNYWQDAWAARPLFERRAGPTPREDIALAINSQYGRSQNQLHIHIDCVRPDVRQILTAQQRLIGQGWSLLNVDLAGHRYRVRRVEGADLGSTDPFRLLAQDPQARADMGRETLVVIGAVFQGGRPGFVLLSDRADPALGDIGHGEDLLDPTCRVLTAH
jgi:CDP-diacylglycerol pyrophosphatase